VRRTGGLALIVVVGLAGAWLGPQLGGHAAAQIGPVRTEMVIQPTLARETVVRPAARLAGPGQPPRPAPATVDVQQLSEQAVTPDRRPGRAVRPACGPPATCGTADHGGGARGDRGGGLRLPLGRWCSAADLAGAGRGRGVAGRAGRQRRDAAATWNPALGRATPACWPGPVAGRQRADIAIRFSLYRRELAGLVSNVTRLYAAPDLPVFRPTRTRSGARRSDIHDNPAAWNVMHSIASQFAVNFIIDSAT
jgi:hypothetical protein